MGEIVTNEELMKRRANAKLGNSEAFTLALHANWKSDLVVDDDVALCIDDTFFGNVTRFLNHRYLPKTVSCEFELHMLWRFL